MGADQVRSPIPGALHPCEMVVLVHAGLYSAMGWDVPCQKDLYPRLPAIVHMLVLVAT
jgi:hypothetical protein